MEFPRGRRGHCKTKNFCGGVITFSGTHTHCLELKPPTTLCKYPFTSSGNLKDLKLKTCPKTVQIFYKIVKTLVWMVWSVYDLTKFNVVLVWKWKIIPYQFFFSTFGLRTVSFSKKSTRKNAKNWMSQAHTTHSLYLHCLSFLLRFFVLPHTFSRKRETACSLLCIWGSGIYLSLKFHFRLGTIPHKMADWR